MYSIYILLVVHVFFNFIKLLHPIYFIYINLDSTVFVFSVISSVAEKLSEFDVSLHFTLSSDQWWLIGCALSSIFQPGAFLGDSKGGIKLVKKWLAISRHKRETDRMRGKISRDTFYKHMYLCLGISRNSI